jgi:hypothetical protein
MKAIKYQGVLWLKSGKCRTIEHPVFDVDEVLLQNKQQAEENGRLKELVSEIPELLGEYDGIHNCIGKHCAICRINAFKAATMKKKKTKKQAAEIEQAKQKIAKHFGGLPDDDLLMGIDEIIKENERLEEENEHLKKDIEINNMGGL